MNRDYRWLKYVLGLSMIPLLNTALRIDIKALRLHKDKAFKRREVSAIAERLLRPSLRWVMNEIAVSLVASKLVGEAYGRVISVLRRVRDCGTVLVVETTRKSTEGYQVLTEDGSLFH